jgi:hypothetical protein
VPLVEIRPARPDEEPAASLVAATVSEMSERYGAEDPAIDPDQVVPPRGAFLIGSPTSGTGRLRPRRSASRSRWGGLNPPGGAADGTPVGIGASIVLLAVGAIMTFALNVTTEGIDLDTVGVILMIAGGLGLVISLLFWSSVAPFGSRTADRTFVREERF